MCIRMSMYMSSMIMYIYICIYTRRYEQTQTTDFVDTQIWLCTYATCNKWAYFHTMLIPGFEAHYNTHCNAHCNTHYNAHCQTHRNAQCKTNCKAQCNTLQHTTTHCNTLQTLYSSTMFVVSLQRKLQRTPQRTMQRTLQRTLQHTATHCNTLQHLHFHALFIAKFST